MIIKKVSQTTPIQAQVVDGYSQSTTNAYSANYINTTYKNTILNAVYPIGSIYLSVNDVNPDVLFGGTWVRIGVGRTLISAGGGTNSTPVVDTNDYTGRGTISPGTDWFPANQRGGEFDHTLSVNEMPSHNHESNDGKLYLQDVGSSDNNFGWHVQTVSGYRANPCAMKNTGGSQSHNNVPPYLSVYMWKRTA